MVLSVRTGARRVWNWYRKRRERLRYVDRNPNTVIADGYEKLFPARPANAENEHTSHEQDRRRRARDQEELARLEAELMEFQYETERQQRDESTRWWAGSSPEERERRTPVAARRAAREEARRLARQNRERAERNPLLPLSWVAPRQVREIARVRTPNEWNVYVEEMIEVNARSWHMESGERIQLHTHFPDELSSDFRLRLMALAMELSAREIEDAVLEDRMEGWV